MESAQSAARQAMNSIRTEKLHNMQNVGYHSNFLDYTTPFCFQELISVIISPPITPNKFWGFNKRNSQEKLHHPVLFLSGKYTPFTPKYSQGINLRNKFTSVTPENSWGINCVILEGTMVCAVMEGLTVKARKM